MNAPGARAADAAGAIGRVSAGVLKAVAVLVSFCAMAVIGGFFFFVHAIPRAEAPPLAPADGIVVLTGGSQRIDDALHLLSSGQGRRLLVSGVYERTSRARIASQNPAVSELFNCCIDLDYRARNTIGNAIETRRWARSHDFRTLIVVTSNYHMPRALVEMRSLLGDYELRPYSVVSASIDPDAWWRSATAARLLIGEYGKYLVALVRTRIEGDPEFSHVAVMVGGRKPLSPPVYVR